MKIDIYDLAVAFGVSHNTVYQYVYKGILPGCEKRRKQWTPEQLDAWFSPLLDSHLEGLKQLATQWFSFRVRLQAK